MQKVLIIDDEPLNIKLLEVYLEPEPYKIISAPNATQAQEMLQQHPDTAIILLDRMMPDIDGIEFVNIIKLDARYKDIPIIMQTAAAGQDKIMEGLSCGVDHYLTKPYDQETLIALIRTFIKSEA